MGKRPWSSRGLGRGAAVGMVAGHFEEGVEGCEPLTGGLFECKASREMSNGSETAAKNNIRNTQREKKNKPYSQSRQRGGVLRTQ